MARAARARMGSGGETCPRSLSERIAVLRGSGLTMRARRNAEMKGRYEPSRARPPLEGGKRLESSRPSWTDHGPPTLAARSLIHPDAGKGDP